MDEKRRLMMKKGPWTPEEDQKLVDYVQRYGHGSWRALSKLAGLNRCGKSCRLRWTNYLRPDIKRGNFSDKEEETIINLHAALGNKWSTIASSLPWRTDNEIKNFWNTHLKKKLLQMGIDPVTHKPITTSTSTISDDHHQYLINHIFLLSSLASQLQLLASSSSSSTSSTSGSCFANDIMNIMNVNPRPAGEPGEYSGESGDININSLLSLQYYPDAKFQALQNILHQLLLTNTSTSTAANYSSSLALDPADHQHQLVCDFQGFGTNTMNSTSTSGAPIVLARADATTTTCTISDSKLVGTNMDQKYYHHDHQQLELENIGSSSYATSTPDPHQLLPPLLDSSSAASPDISVANQILESKINSTKYNSNFHNHHLISSRTSSSTTFEACGEDLMAHDRHPTSIQSYWPKEYIIDCLASSQTCSISYVDQER